MRFGYWLPVFGFDLTLIAELLLNDIKGIEAPAPDAWSTAAALAAVTQRLWAPFPSCLGTAPRS